MQVESVLDYCLIDANTGQKIGGVLYGRGAKTPRTRYPDLEPRVVMAFGNGSGYPVPATNH